MHSWQRGRRVVQRRRLTDHRGRPRHPIVRLSDRDRAVGDPRRGERGAPAITVKEWTEHQKKWLPKGNKRNASLSKVKTAQQARRGLGNIQKHFRAETQWLKKSRSRYEPESCLAEDMARWQQRIRQAQKSLNKTITAMDRGNVAALSSNIRQFGRAWTKVEQIYGVGICDF